MNGAESLIGTAVAAGVDVCFANPGTTEIPLVAALDRVRGIRSVLGLFEGVCTGAADGYGRMSDRPALTLLHLGPGLANGIANLHNARRARTPVVNLVGDHATWHLAADSPLTSDIESLARPVSRWFRTSRCAEDLSTDVAAAIGVARRGGVATLVVPADCQWGEVSRMATPADLEVPRAGDDGSVDTAAKLLRGKEPVALFLGGRALRTPGLRAAARIAARTSCRLLCETFPSRMERGRGLPSPERLPYMPEQARERLAGIHRLVLCGATEPVAFFGYPDGASRLVPEACGTLRLAGPEEDATAALLALAEALGANGASAAEESPVPERPTGKLDTVSLGAAVASVQPEGAIVMEEAVTSGLGYFPAAGGAPPHTLLTLTGGSIGQGPPCAAGAAIACPDRPVINLQADGAALYTQQALWTQAREGLNVTTVLCSNRSYRILRVELLRAGIAEPGRHARSLTDLGDPPIDWVAIGRGFGVPSSRVDTADDLVRALERSVTEPGPSLIEAVLAE